MRVSSIKPALTKRYEIIEMQIRLELVTLVKLLGASIQTLKINIGYSRNKLLNTQVPLAYLKWLKV